MKMVHRSTGINLTGPTHAHANIPNTPTISLAVGAPWAAPPPRRAPPPLPGPRPVLLRRLPGTRPRLCAPHLAERGHGAGGQGDEERGGRAGAQGVAAVVNLSQSQTRRLVGWLVGWGWGGAKEWKGWRLFACVLLREGGEGVCKKGERQETRAAQWKAAVD